jgi:hypothetical protein
MKRLPDLLRCAFLAAIPVLIASPALAQDAPAKKSVSIQAAKKNQAKPTQAKRKTSRKTVGSNPKNPAARAAAPVKADSASGGPAPTRIEAAAASVPALPSAAAALDEKPAATAAAAPAATNPYLAARPEPAVATPAVATLAVAAPLVSAPARPQTANPYLVYASAPQAAEVAAAYRPAPPFNALGNLRAMLPSLPDEGAAILPRIKKVYPTGEKPLVVLTFKCPTELVGVSTPPIKLLRSGIDLAMEGINRTDVLPFNLQQVCM